VIGRVFSQHGKFIKMLGKNCLIKKMGDIGRKKI